MNPTARKALRPHVPTAAAATAEERFQNDTLRPLLKLQHPLLLATFRHYLAKRKVPYQNMPKAAFREKTENLLTRDNRLRGLLFGMVIGMFDEAELDYYLENESAVNRRITGMLVERVISGLLLS